MAFYTIFSKSGRFPPPVGEAEAMLIQVIGASKNMFMGKAREFLKRYVPVATGHLRNSADAWGARVYSLGGVVFYLGWRNRDFGGVNYAPFVDQGTGIYGAHRTPIRPRSATRLKWQQNGAWKSAPTVAGQPGRFMLRDAIQDFTDWFLIWLEKQRVNMYRRMV